MRRRAASAARDACSRTALRSASRQIDARGTHARLAGGDPLSEQNDAHRGPWHFRTLAIGALAAVAVLSTVHALGHKPAETPEATAARVRLENILAKFDETQTATKTLTATFTERKDLGLLKDPIV